MENWFVDQSEGDVIDERQGNFFGRTWALYLEPEKNFEVFV